VITGGVLFLLLLIALPLSATGLSLLRIRHTGVAKRYAVESGVAVALCATLMSAPLDVPSEGQTALRAVTFFAYLWPLYAWVRVVRATQLRWYDVALGVQLLATIALPFWLADRSGPTFCDGIVSHFESCLQTH